MKKLVVFISLIFHLLSSAQSTFEEDGIVYIEDFSDPSRMAVVVMPKLSPRTGELSLYSGKIRIPSKITHNLDTYDVIGISRGAFYSKSVEEVIIEDGIEFIDEHAIYSESLKKLRLPGSTKSIRWITAKNLEEIEFGEGIEFLGEIFIGPVANLKFPESLKEISGFTAEKEHNYLEPLQDDEWFPKSVRFGNNVEVLQYCFNSGFGGEELSIPASCRSVSNSFGTCPALKTLDLKEGLMEIRESFKNVNELQRLNIPNSVKIIEDSFVEDGKLEKLDLGTGLQTIKKSFVRVPSLRKLKLPDSLTTIDRSFEFSENNDDPRFEVLYFGEGYDRINRRWIKWVKELYCPWSQIPSAPDFDSDYYHGMRTLTIYVPKGMEEDYIKAWKLGGWKGITVKGFKK